MKHIKNYLLFIVSFQTTLAMERFQSTNFFDKVSKSVEKKQEARQLADATENKELKAYITVLEKAYADLLIHNKTNELAVQTLKELVSKPQPGKDKEWTTPELLERLTEHDSIGDILLDIEKRRLQLKKQALLAQEALDNQHIKVSAQKDILGMIPQDESSTSSERFKKLTESLMAGLTAKTEQGADKLASQAITLQIKSIQDELQALDDVYMKACSQLTDADEFVKKLFNVEDQI